MTGGRIVPPHASGPRGNDAPFNAIVQVHAEDVCQCGDYRHQHVDGVGRCKLGSLCQPSPCGRFRLFRAAPVGTRPKGGDPKGLHAKHE